MYTVCIKCPFNLSIKSLINRTDKIIRSLTSFSSLHLKFNKASLRCTRIFTDRQRSCGKVMFLQVFVCPRREGICGARSLPSLWSHVLSRGGSRIPRKRGAPTLQGVPTYDLANFCEKLHEIEEILGRGGGCAPGAPPKSATAFWG